MLLQVHETYARIDDLTRDHALTVQDSSVEARTRFQRQFEAFCIQTLDAVHQSRDGDKAALVERHLGDMTRIDSQLLSLMTDRHCMFIFLELIDLIITSTPTKLLLCPW